MQTVKVGPVVKKTEVSPYKGPKVVTIQSGIVHCLFCLLMACKSTFGNSVMAILKRKRDE